MKQINDSLVQSKKEKINNRAKIAELEKQIDELNVSISLLNNLISSLKIVFNDEKINPK